MCSEFFSYVDDILNDEDFLKLKDYRHHYNTTRYHHCVNVAYASYLLAKKFKVKNMREVVRAALLHDFFLYDWHGIGHKKELGWIKGFHAFYHPFIALEESKKKFDISDREADIILAHMFPCYLGIPKYKESWVVILTDKYCSIEEGLFRKNFCSGFVF